MAGPDAAQAGHALPGYYYHDAAVFAEDMAWLAGRWVFAAHGSELPGIGDRVVARLGRDEAIIVRDQAGAARAFANVCRHRGARLCDGAGTGRMLLCPYHGWRYGLDGRLMAAAAMPDGFAAEAHGLVPLALAERDGLIFVSFGAAPPAIGPGLDALARLSGPYGWAGAKVAARAEYSLAANWKLLLENYHECYHCGPAHPEFSAVHALARPDGRTLTGDDREHWPAVADGVEMYRVMRSALLAGCASGSRDGGLVAPRMAGNVADGVCLFAELGALSAFLAYADHGVIYRFRPVAPEASVMDVTWLVRGDAKAGRDYDEARLTWLWRVTSEADKAIIERNQRGVADRNYRPGPYSAMEPATAQFTARYLAERAAGG